MKNLGLIVLGVSMVISSIILSISIKSLRDGGDRNISALHSFNGNVPIELHHDSAPHTNELLFDDSTRLYVVTKLDNRKRYFEGENLVATYWRDGDFLQVTYIEGNKKKLKYIAAPLEWGNEE